MRTHPHFSIARLRTVIPAAFFTAGALLLSGCTPTNVVMASQQNPELAGHIFTKILAVGAFENLAYRRTAEKKLCYEINSDTDIECLESSQVFFAGENYS